MIGQRATSVFDALREKILRGVFKSKFPSERALMRDYKVSRTTVREVMSELEAHQLIERRPGSGTFLVDNASHRASGIFGVILPDMKDSFCAAMLEGISRSVKKTGGGYSLLTSDLGDGTKAVIAAAERLGDLYIGERVAGVFLRPLPAAQGKKATLHLIELLRAAGIPVVVLDGDAAKLPQGTGCDLVGAKGYGKKSLDVAPLLGDIAFRLMLQRLANPSHPPAEVLLDPPCEPIGSARAQTASGRARAVKSSRAK